MNKQNDRDLDFLLVSYGVDETSDRLSAIEQKILMEITAGSSSAQPSNVSDRWVQILSTSAVVAALAVALVNIPMWESSQHDIYNLYMSGSYLFIGG